MASIQQAAKWMQEGKSVRRASWFEFNNLQTFKTTEDVIWQTEHGTSATVPQLRTTDVLAEDWELAD
jgi:hypothetical protein